MLLNYLKIARRNLLKQWNYSLINVLGLSVAMAACMLILLYVQYEFSFDKQHENRDRIYRVTREWYNTDGSTNLHLGHAAPTIAPLLKNDYPEITHAARLHQLGAFTVIQGENHFQERIFAADPVILKVFTFPFVEGDPDSALNDPNSIVISETSAERLFGGESALGRILTVSIGDDQFVEAKVGGVMKDVPDNSHFHFDMLIPMDRYRMIAGDSELQNWGSNNYGTYVLFEKGYNVDRFIETEAPSFLHRHLSEQYRTRIHLQRLTDIHLHSNLDSEYEVNGNITHIYVLSGVALLVLLVACINYMNLATASSLKRAKEVSIRKSLGAERSQLIGQFLGESILLAFLSMMVSLILIELFLPWFNQLASRELSLNPFQNLTSLFGLIAIGSFVGVGAGSYPAFFLSAFDSIKNPGSKNQAGSSHSIMRQFLVVFQFVVTIVLLVSVGAVRKQMDYCKEKDLGLKKENIVLIPANTSMINNYQSLKQRFLKHPQITNVANSKRTPSAGLLDDSGSSVYDGDTLRSLDFRLANVRINEDFIPTYEIEMVAGRNFSLEYPTDSTRAFILNEAAVKRIGWSSPEDALGRAIVEGNREGTIIGVVKDFHYESLRKSINPIIFYIDPSSYNFMSIRIRQESADGIESILDYMESVWREYNSDIPFDYTFLDERYNQLYRAEQRLGLLFGAFSILAIVIACLGLFGLAAFMTEQRTKEIGIRKVMGASVRDILFMLSWDTVCWVILANVIAWPVAWYLMNQWLQNFAYRTELNLTLFILSGGSALLIAWLTVTWQTMKAANANPISSLRYE